jgi:hypothetical protein
MASPEQQKWLKDNGFDGLGEHYRDPAWTTDEGYEVCQDHLGPRAACPYHGSTARPRAAVSGPPAAP